MRRSALGRVLASAVLVVAGIAVFAWFRRRARAGALDAAPADVGFMYAMHNAFRRDLDRLERAAADRAVPRAGWETFRAQLDFHHRAEDDDLWPSVRARTSVMSELQVVDEMVAEHARIPPLLGAVARAIEDGGDVAGTVGRLAQEVRAHLDHEEQVTLPIVEARLSDADWHSFLRTERRKSGRRGAEFLTWVLDDASAADADAVLRELPPPGRRFYRLVLKPRYDASDPWELHTAGAADGNAAPNRLA